MTKEIEFDDIPAFGLVRDRIHVIDSRVEFVKAGRDKDFDIYTLRLRLAASDCTDLKLPENLLKDLSGTGTPECDARIESLVRIAIDRMKRSACK